MKDIFEPTTPQEARQELASTPIPDKPQPPESTKKRPTHLTLIAVGLIILAILAFLIWLFAT